MPKAALVAILIPAMLLSGCATMETPRNAPGSLYAREQQARFRPETPQCQVAPVPAEVAGLQEVPVHSLTNAVNSVAEGDRLQLTIAGDTARYTGSYIVSGNGMMELAGGIRVRAAGKTVDALERDLRAELLNRGIVRAVTGNIRLQHVEQAGLPIPVTGAVFGSGIARVGERQADTRSMMVANPASGDLNVNRTLSTALRAAGGVRPDASISDVVLIRGGQWARVDMRGALDGTTVSDVALATGDRIIVGSVGCLQPELVRPSSITIPGIRVFMSNLSGPAQGNGASAIGSESTSLPYGTRFLQGLVSANCVGGSAMNAGRSAVLISRNPVTGQSVVISRSVERLVRGSDRDAYDPYLMPGDSIVCYDSMAMNLREVISTVSASVTPYVLFNSVKD
ncbi:polysaccharide biosynthesis protein [Sphingomonas lacunae]|uniref:Polysaccharide biosynthesis protein n=1 Tax=Sphingomonas lacunae TaxID=2698828 RepID=A0A6M4ARZ9_9SPHN|nr:polysaccharide biosynthesis protein [Sphingomonas lacunae]QJQ31142.1 polysaccharide biosynthesis protein [Sphingomonas lacunae]